MAAKQLKMTLSREKETPNCFRYRHLQGEDGEIVYAYLKKSAAKKIGNPESITITVEAAK